MRALAFGCCLALAAAAGAETVVDVTGVGATKFAVELHVSNRAFADCLKKNLELSGLFLVGQKGTIRVSGAPGAIRAEGRGKVVSGLLPNLCKLAGSAFIGCSQICFGLCMRCC